MLFDGLKVKVKVKLPIWLLAMFTITVAAYSLYTLRESLEHGHLDKIQAIVETGQAIAQDNYKLYKSGLITEDEAQYRARNAIRAMEFDHGSRVFVFDTKGTRLVSNHLYAEGTSAWEAPQTQSMIKQALNGGGRTYYSGARILKGVKTHGVPKVAWSQHFAPWGWVIASAAYVDDVTTAFLEKLMELALFLGGAGILVIMTADAIARSITTPLSELTNNMKQLVAGNTKVKISGAGRGDEIGEMASAMQTFVAHETQRLKLQAQLTDLAYTDSLTGLPNRAVFYQALRMEIEAAQESGTQCALLILDLDRFKSINDSFGHIAGDTLLVELSKRLKAQLGDSAIFGRLSGDEFFVILSDLRDLSEVDNLANAILAEAKKPFTLEGIPVHISTSIGLAFAPSDNTNESKLYNLADLALYEAKQSGGSSFARYSPAMGQRVEKRYELEAMIKEALLGDQFKAHFQAKISMQTRKVIGAEALCRWEHPEKGMISPIEFIPIAEETGQIIEIGTLMLKQACEFAVQCNINAQEPFVVAVNVSPKQLSYGRFLASLGKCLEETGCKASWIELEITESLLLNDCDKIVSLLETISALGVDITIDDFGTGYSAMSYLHRFPIKCLKIDQSFVRDMLTDNQKQVLVSAMLAMANGLGLKTVAEGVETEDIADALSDLKCDIGQGYLWHRPSPASDLLEQMKQQEAA